MSDSGDRREPRGGLALLLLMMLAMVGAPAEAQQWSAERLYRDGLLLDGQFLRGDRPDGIALGGPDAACVNCHRRSGLGTAEGKSVIPPISGAYLFHARNTRGLQTEPAASDRGAPVRPPYTEATLARALREGIASDGRPLSVLMPRYRIDDANLGALTAYLRNLGTGPTPGVSDDTLHFATIVTPDADAAAREGMLATLNQFFQDRNHIIAGEARPLQHTDRGVMYRVTRKWQLHVWELTGDPDGWTAQLRRFFEQQPVFAVVSGLGGSQWEPVHHFCELTRLPCLFPNIDVPVEQESDFFPVYFSRGVFLEAALLAEELTAAPPAPGQAAPLLVQVARAGGHGAIAARRLAELVSRRGWRIDTRVLSVRDGADALARAVAVPEGSRLALWLESADIAALPAAPPPAHAWLSGLLGGLEQMPLPSAWWPRATLTYPFELPEKRVVAMKLPEGWFAIKHVALVDPRVQLQTFIACQILSETVGELQASFVPEYLVERVEVMLSHRRLNGMYPRLSLGTQQRFASKGAYLVHFVAPARIAADGDWRIP